MSDLAEKLRAIAESYRPASNSDRVPIEWIPAVAHEAARAALEAAAAMIDARAREWEHYTGNGNPWPLEPEQARAKFEEARSIGIDIRDLLPADAKEQTNG